MRALMESVFRDLGTLVPGRRSRASKASVGKDMVFARLLSAGVTETVTVAEVIHDGSGNPHIRYNVSLRDQHGTYDEGTRVLALATFLQNYQRVS